MTNIHQRVPSSIVNALGSANIAVFGLGSVGSYVAEQLIRTGLGSITLVDHDEVESSNLSRSVYSSSDIGRKKVDALSARLRDIKNVQITTFDARVQEIDTDELKQIFDHANLIIGATDDPQAQSIINACAYYSSKPAVYIGLYEKANGGEVVYTIPSITPCYQCSIGVKRVESQTPEQNTDYGTGRLQGEIALGCDIHFVTNAALKCIFSIFSLVQGIDNSLASLVFNAASKKQNFIGFGMTEDYWFFPHVFKDTPGQHMFQSVWLNTAIADDCLICSQSDMFSPFSKVAATPVLEEFE